jgi:hypothetical protein
MITWLCQEGHRQKSSCVIIVEFIKNKEENDGYQAIVGIYRE